MSLPEQHPFLATFFSEGNSLRWSKICRNEIPTQSLIKFVPWINTLIESKDPVVLPRVMPDKKVYWYALAYTDKQLGELREMLQAQIGVSYSDFDGIRAELNPRDPIEAAIASHFDGRVFRFCTGEHQTLEQIDKVFEFLLQMRLQMQHRPALIRHTVRPQGRILRDINSALYRHAPQQAIDYLDELKQGGGIGYQNELFIELRCLAAANDWQQIMEHPDLLQILDLPRPILLTDALLQATYQQLLFSFEVCDDIRGQIQLFDELIIKRMPGLFKGKMTAKSSTGAKMWLLKLLADSKPDFSKAERLIATLIDTSVDDQKWFTLLLTQFPQIIEPVEIVSNKSKLLDLKEKAQDDPQYILTKILEFPIDLKYAALALECAWSLETPESAQQCLQLLDRLDKSNKEVLLSNHICNKYYAIIKSLMPNPTLIIVNWNDWLAQVLDTPDWKLAEQIAEEGAINWSGDSLNIDLFCQQVTQASNSIEAGQQLRLVIPFLLSWSGRHPEINGLGNIWQELLQLLLLDDQHSKEDLYLVYELSREYLTGMVTSEGYQDFIDILEMFMDSIGADNINQRLDILELLVVNNSPNKKLLHSLVNGCYAYFCINPKRYERHEWLLLLTLAKEAGLNLVQPDIVDETGVVDEVVKAEATLNGLRVAIYTLTESVGLRVKKQLEQRFPSIKVQLNHDKVATDSLLALANNADLFVFAWLSSAHQAFYPIRDARRQHNKPLLLPEGKGSSSMMRCLLDYQVS